MREECFVNIAFEESIKSYIVNANNPNSVLYNTSFVVIIRILILIYGKLDILNPYYLKNSVVFMSNLSKFGVSKSEIALFKDEFLKFYEFEKENEKRKIKIKNPYFTNMQKYLTDMFVAKKRNEKVPLKEEETFLDLIYSSHTTNPYRIAYNYLMSDDLSFIEKYYYSKLNEMDVTQEIALEKTINGNLNLEALNYLGVSLSNLKNMSNEEIAQSQNKAYEYFEVDAESPNRDEDLKEAIDYYKMHGKKLTSGNGYVDILLLMSVIVTSLSVISIIIFTII
ncbi:unknown [Mycoplasma sp. CAG:776]|nr:unknown [Mycoplasma sp. CAG:776]